MTETGISTGAVRADPRSLSREAKGREVASQIRENQETPFAFKRPLELYDGGLKKLRAFALKTADTGEERIEEIEVGKVETLTPKEERQIALLQKLRVQLRDARRLDLDRSEWTALNAQSMEERAVLKDLVLGETLGRDFFMAEHRLREAWGDSGLATVYDAYLEVQKAKQQPTPAR